MIKYEDALAASIAYFDGDELAAKVFIDKYALRDNNGNLLEKTPTDMHRRLSKEFAIIEKEKYGKEALEESEIFSYLDKFRYIVPQGSIMYGLGSNKYVSLSNCFVLGTEKPIYDSYAGIMYVDEQLVNISKRRGGVGIDLSELRPNNSTTNNSSRTSTGIIPFAKRFSNSIREVGQSGRRGAALLSLSIHHPEVLAFINCKKDLKEVTGANISVRITNEFLEAVKNNEEYELRWPVNSKNPKITQMVKAREVWDELISNVHAHAEPGILMWDNIREQGPAEYYDDFMSVGTNPCCFDVNSQVMVVTNHGIKEIKNVTSQDKIWINETREFVDTSGYFISGTDNVYSVELSNGETLKLTGNHKLCDAVPKRVGSKIQYIESQTGKAVSDLRVGDKIMIHTSECHNEVFHGSNTYEEGLVLGWLTGDGCLSYKEIDDTYPTVILDFWENDAAIIPHVERAIDALGCKKKHEKKSDWKYKTRITCSSLSKSWTEQNQQSIWQFRSHDKDIPYLYQSSVEFLRGFISAYFSADGTVAYNKSASRHGISLVSINKSRLHQISYILATFGIKSSVKPLNSGGKRDFNDGYGPYDCSPTHRLIITGIGNIKRFAQHFNLYPKNKADSLRQICEVKQQYQSKESQYTKVVKITKEEQPVKVGCINVEKYHKFTANGIISFNSELPLPSLDSCRLLVVNVFSFVKEPFTKNASIDWQNLYKTFKVAQRLMDDVVDLEIKQIDKIIDKIENDPEPAYIKEREINMWKIVRQKCKDGRRTGTGITGVGDLLAAIGCKYDSEKGLETVEEVYKVMKFACYESSIEMAEKLGPFPVFNHKKEMQCPFFQRFSDETIQHGNLKKSGHKLMQRMKKSGRRNIALTTTSPAGSISILTQTTSGIEPLFQMAYKRRKKGNPQDKDFRSDFVDKTGDHWMEFTVWHPKLKTWLDVTKEEDIEKSPYFGSCAEDLNYLKRVELQARAQKHVCSSISSTINLPEDITVRQVKNIYMKAYELGCKGITVYRKNCRDGVILDLDKGQADDIIEERPRELPCDVHHTTVFGKSYFVLVGLLDGKPYEVFAGKNGFLPKKVECGTIIRKRKNFYVARFDNGDELSPITAATEELEEIITRLTSLSLRLKSDIHKVVQQLEKVGERRELNGFARCIARILKKYIPDGTSEGAKCPKCSCELIREEGCIKCTCGWSKCI